MSAYSHRALAITAALNEVKSKYLLSATDPNRILQSLIAALARMGIPFRCAETHEMAQDMVASYLNQIYLHHWLETSDCWAVPG